MDEDEIAELINCRDCSMYFAETYIPEATAMEQFMLHAVLFNYDQSSMSVFATIREARESMLAIMSGFECLPGFMQASVVSRTTTRVRFDNGCELIHAIDPRAIQGRALANLAISTRLPASTLEEIRGLKPMLMNTACHYF